MKKPLIGITLDHELSGNYSKFPWYAIRENYLSCIDKFRAIPIPLFHEKNTIKEICKLINGLVLTGGNFDINPKLYSKKNEGTRNLKQRRTDFEIEIFNEFFSTQKPILGICGGAQLINVSFGGTLIQDISKTTSNKINHEQQNPRDQTSHKIKIEKKTKLFNIIKKNEIKVNSAHHQSIDKLGKNLVKTAYSYDNIVEAIEHKKHNWCIGVQWHPEFLITNGDKSLIKNFVSSCFK